MRKAAVLYLIITVVLSVSSVVTGNTSRPEHLKDTQVLILVGPQYGLPMVDQLLPALMHDLKEGGISLNNIFIEFLDLHRNTDPQYRANVIALLEHKMKEREPELIIAINQGAVDFVASDGKNLCPGVPLMIPILEKHPEWEGEPRKLITLTTQQDAAGTLSYALRLFPETKRAVIIMGKDDHEAPFVEPISVALDAMRNGLEIETMADLSYEDMLAIVSNLPPNTVAFYGSYFHDITGRSFVPAEVARKVGETANVPVFAFRDMHIVSGLTGGSVAITADMGRLAAQISLEYFDSKLVLEEPVTNFDVPNFPLFNWMQLKQMGGDISTLPENTIFLNRPLTIWEQHREMVITAAISFVLLVLLLIALAFKTRQQKKLIIKLNEAENILRQREQKFKSVFESANVGKSITLPTGEVNVNQAFCDMLGYSPGELRNTKWQDITPQDEIAGVQKILDPLLKGEKDSARFEKRYICENGTNIWADVNVSVQRDENGKPLHFITTVIDITMRKRAEEEILQLNKDLEQRVLDRTALLEASNKELEAFSYSVSHDLRAPLRHINGFVGMLNQDYSDGLPEKARQYLNTISGASSQMGSLIDALLQYSRTGRQEIRKSELDMNLLLKEVTYQLKSGLEKREINWDIQQLPKVSGDIVLLKQVWANLLDNAIKYTRNQKTTEISVGCREETKEFVFWVKDNGTGFDMKYAHKLFGVFQRLHSKTEFEGTGIGLASVQRIVHKHLGRVWAEAEPGKGAKFYFSLPKISKKT